jgi:hypothetical protein
MSDIKAGDRVVSKFGSVSGKVLYIGTEVGPDHASIQVDGLLLPIQYPVYNLVKLEQVGSTTPTDFAGTVAMVILLIISILGVILTGFGAFFSSKFLIPAGIFVLSGSLASYRLLKSRK